MKTAKVLISAVLAAVLLQGAVLPASGVRAAAAGAEAEALPDGSGAAAKDGTVTSASGGAVQQLQASSELSSETDTEADAGKTAVLLTGTDSEGVFWKAEAEVPSDWKIQSQNSGEMTFQADTTDSMDVILSVDRSQQEKAAEDSDISYMDNNDRFADYAITEPQDVGLESGLQATYFVITATVEGIDCTYSYMIVGNEHVALELISFAMGQGEDAAILEYDELKEIAGTVGISIGTAKEQAQMSEEDAQTQE